MASGAQMGADNVERLRAYIEERMTRRAFPMSGEKLNKSALAKACGFSRSVLRQNPACKALIEKLQEDLGASAPAKPSSVPGPARRRLTDLERRVTSLEGRNAALSEENAELKRELVKLGWSALDKTQATDDQLRLPW